MKFVILCAALLLVAPALAAEIDFSTHIVDLDGKDIPSSPAKDAPPLDLATVAGMALLSEPPADPRNPGQPKDTNEKLRRFALAVKTHAGGKVTVSAEDIALLKSAISSAYAALVVGRAVEILDPPAK